MSRNRRFVTHWCRNDIPHVEHPVGHTFGGAGIDEVWCPGRLANYARTFSADELAADLGAYDDPISEMPPITEE